MPANTSPIYTVTPAVGFCLPNAANTKTDGAGTIGTDIFLLYTATSNGDLLNKIIFTPFATTASTATTATCFRVYLSTQTSGSTTSSNTRLIGEIAAPAQTADAPTAGTTSLVFPLGFPIPSGQSVLVSMHHALAASTGWHVALLAGSY